MSTRSTTGKTKGTAKSAAKTPAAKSTLKSLAKSSAKAESATPPKTKARLEGPKPPKARKASASKPAASVRKPEPTGSTTPVRRSTSKIPAPDMTSKTAVPTPLPVELKKSELIDLVVTRSDIKKKYAKPVIEAMLEVLGETVAKGREMNLQPFGKMKYNRTKETTSARVVVTKIRQSKPSKAQASPPKDPLADAAE